MSVDDAWHVYMVRKTGLMSHAVCLHFGVNLTFHVADLIDGIASILYIELVSLLDEGFEARMVPADYARCARLHNRIGKLESAGDLVDARALKAINDRRNEIGHELDKPATQSELEEAVAVVKAQFEAWKLITDRGPYELHYARENLHWIDEPDCLYEQDFTIEIRAQGQRVSGFTETRRFPPGTYYEQQA